MKQIVIDLINKEIERLEDVLYGTRIQLKYARQGSEIKSALEKIVKVGEESIKSLKDTLADEQNWEAAAKYWKDQHDALLKEV